MGNVLNVSLGQALAHQATRIIVPLQVMSVQHKHKGSTRLKLCLWHLKVGKYNVQLLFLKMKDATRYVLQLCNLILSYFLNGHDGMQNSNVNHGFQNFVRGLN
jgi:hypothetical protein